MIAVPCERAATVTVNVKESWSKGEAYRFLVEVTKDEVGIYSAVALNLPGTGSCGDTREEAIENFKEAATGNIEYYAESGEEIPWKAISQSEVPAGAKWVWVNA